MFHPAAKSLENQNSSDIQGIYFKGLITGDIKSGANSYTQTYIGAPFLS